MPGLHGTSQPTMDEDTIPAKPDGSPASDDDPKPDGSPGPSDGPELARSSPTPTPPPEERAEVSNYAGFLFLGGLGSILLGLLYALFRLLHRKKRA